MARVLIVDDEANLRRILGSLLLHEGHEVTEASGLRQAKAVLASHLFDLVITDQKMTDGEGIALVSHCRENIPELPVVMLTAFSTVELAVEVMREGAFDFLTKPFVPEQVHAVVRRALAMHHLSRQNQDLRRELARLRPDEQIIGESPAIEQVRELIARVAPTSATALITGETGTGKELVARAIHSLSPRARGPFVAVNCAGFSETLLESELFGHERGAFTGADRPRQGVFEAADKGTLFLDEASEMSPSVQAKLLRVLMNGEVVRLGSNAPRRVDVRIVVATNRDLEEQVRHGDFREDLYYRIAVVPVPVPPLRERDGDIELLATHFLARATSELSSPRRRLSPAAMAQLRQYRFPGNVRELRNLMERASILARGEVIEPGDLPPLTPSSETPDLADRLRACLADSEGRIEIRGFLEEIETAITRHALASSGGVQAEAARRLGITRSDLGYKLRKLELSLRDEDREPTPDSPAPSRPNPRTPRKPLS